MTSHVAWYWNLLNDLLFVNIATIVIFNFKIQLYFFFFKKLYQMVFCRYIYFLAEMKIVQQFYMCLIWIPPPPPPQKTHQNMYFYPSLYWISQWVFDTLYGRVYHVPQYSFPTGKPLNNFYTFEVILTPKFIYAYVHLFLGCLSM